MELQRAIDQLDAIHETMARSSVYRGYRAGPVALSGVVGLAAAAAQPYLAGNAPTTFIYYWMAVAVLAGAVAASGVAYSYLLREEINARRRTRTAVGQLLPCLAAGLLAAVLVPRAGLEHVALLPGLWAMLFSLGIFASRPFLPRAVGWVGLYFLASGAVLLMLAPSGASLSPWGMGITFGLGQIFAAGVLYRDLERSNGKKAH